MNIFKKKIFNIFTLVLIFTFHDPALAFIDPYPKNPKIDVINYVFDLTLSDEKNEIRCNTTIFYPIAYPNVKPLKQQHRNLVLSQ